MDAIHDKTATELRAGLDAGEFSAVELCSALLTRIEERDAELNSFVTVTPETALAQAKRADERIAALPLQDHRRVLDRDEQQAQTEYAE